MCRRTKPPKTASGRPWYRPAAPLIRHGICGDIRVADRARLCRIRPVTAEGSWNSRSTSGRVFPSVLISPVVPCSHDAFIRHSLIPLFGNDNHPGFGDYASPQSVLLVVKPDLHSFGNHDIFIYDRSSDLCVSSHLDMIKQD